MYIGKDNSMLSRPELFIYTTVQKLQPCHLFHNHFSGLLIQLPYLLNGTLFYALI